MSSTIMFIETSTTVSRMVEIALQGLSFGLEKAQADEQFSEALSRIEPDLILLGLGGENVVGEVVEYAGGASDLPPIISMPIP